MINGEDIFLDSSEKYQELLEGDHNLLVIETSGVSMCKINRTNESGFPRYWPITKVTKVMGKRLGPLEQLEYRYRQAKAKEDIDCDLTIDEFRKNPGVRFVGPPLVDGLPMIIYDDIYHTGRSLAGCVNDLNLLGHSSDELFFLSKGTRFISKIKILS
jgi:hypothetical protein